MKFYFSTDSSFRIQNGKAILASLVIVVVFGKAENAKEKIIVTEFTIDTELPLKVNHKNILMLFTQKRAVV